MDNTKNLVESSGLVYIDPDKKRTKSWMQGLGLRLPSDTTALGSVGRITYPDGKVKIESMPFSQYMQHHSIQPVMKRLTMGRSGEFVVSVTIVSISPSGIFDVSTCTLNLIF